MTRNVLARLIGEEFPTADAGGPYRGMAGIPVLFDGRASSDADGTIRSYAWDFGDGTSGTGVSPTHSYAWEGHYRVSLTVIDDRGAANRAVTTISVGSPPPHAGPKEGVPN
jgi:PKD repeat protein